MKKKIVSSALAGLMLLGSIGTAWAVEGPSADARYAVGQTAVYALSRENGGLTRDAVPLAALAWEPLAAHDTVPGGMGGQTRATESISWRISAGKTMIATSSFPMEAGETVTINTSYSPSSASVDFGLIAPDGLFHYINVTDGSINKTIEVDARGHYTLAVRNNSSNTISVAGFVNY